MLCVTGKLLEIEDMEPIIVIEAGNSTRALIPEIWRSPQRDTLQYSMFALAVTQSYFCSELPLLRHTSCWIV